ncbi:hypothetical protein [Saccharopolyspora sp. NPDC002376]
MNELVVDSEIWELLERIAVALRSDRGCQVLVVKLARRAGWAQTRRLVLSRVHGDDRLVSGSA